MEALVRHRMEEIIVFLNEICIPQKNSYLYFSLLIPSVQIG